MSLPKIRYSRLRFYHFVDAKDQELGTLEDVILDESTLVPTHLILGGGFFEEYMESKGEIDDIDEIAPVELIDHIDNDFIVLNTSLEELETTRKDGSIPIEGHKYSKFISYPLANNEGPLDGEIFDFHFNQENSSILVNILTLEEKLREMGYYQKLELQVPISDISVEDNTVIINYTVDQLCDMVKGKAEPRQNGRSNIKLL